VNPLKESNFEGWLLAVAFRFFTKPFLANGQEIISGENQLLP